MRIISDFKDYYDSAQVFGIDPNLTYARKRQVLDSDWRIRYGKSQGVRVTPELESILEFPLKQLRNLPHAIVRVVRRTAYFPEIPFTTKIIGFCGCLYPAISIDNHTFYDTHKIATGVSAEFLKTFRIDAEVFEEILSFSEPKYYVRYYPSADPLTHKTWHDKTREMCGRRFDDIFIRLGMPVFVIEIAHSGKRRWYSADERYTLNAYLKLEQFQKVKGPAEAFQEISMYLGNQLARQPDPISNVPDEIMRDEKGFDEWSFRRHKEEDKKYKKKLGKRDSS